MWLCMARVPPFSFTIQYPQSAAQIFPAGMMGVHVRELTVLRLRSNRFVLQMLL